MRGFLSKRMPFLLMAILLVSLSGCLAPPTSTPPPTLQPVEVALTPAVAPVQTALHTCAVAQPETALLLTETTAPFLPVQTADLSIWFGPPPAGAGFTAPLSEEEILVIANPANPISKMGADALRSIFNGEYERWDELEGKNQLIQVWVYPEGDEISQVFRQAILADKPFSSLARLAPDPSAMREAVSEDPTAIGFLPQAWLSPDVKPIRLDQDIQDSLRQPILALSGAEPQGAVREFLYCLQSGAGQEMLLEHYPARESLLNPAPTP
jgi:hypothetical protein